MNNQKQMRNQFTQEYTTAGGLTFWLDPNSQSSACLPGIDLNNRPPYKNVFFGAEREYAENEGWITIRRRVPKKKSHQ